MPDQKRLKCPECDADVTLPEGTEAGEIINCPPCSVDLEFTGTALELAPEEDEDWGE